MIISLFAVLVIVAVGSRATDAVRLSQAENILDPAAGGRSARLLRSAAPAGARRDRHARDGGDRAAVHLLGAPAAADAKRIGTGLRALAAGASRRSRSSRRRRAARAAASPPPVFEGTGSRPPAAPRPFHGSWSAQALPGQPDDVQGSWSLVNDAGDTVAQGTWSAERRERGLQGELVGARRDRRHVHGHLRSPPPRLQGQDAPGHVRRDEGRADLRLLAHGPRHGAWYLKGPAP